MSSAELKKAKRAVRRRVRALRDAVSEPERERAAAAIQARVLEEIDARTEVRTVLSFWSFGSEIETAGLVAPILERGIVVAYPRIVEGELEARSFRPGDPVTETEFGAMEPATGELVAPEEIDVVLTPGLAFDRAGHRTGYGGGYYDRYLARTRPDALKLAVAFGVQVLDEIPVGSFDLPVDLIVTEEETIRTRT